MGMLVLASKSPRRAEILRQAGFHFVVRPSAVAERREAGEAPADYVRRLAIEKADAASTANGEIVLSADTVVVAGGKVLEKPDGRAGAASMLRDLSGREHEVITGICLRSASRRIVDAAITRVWFLPMSELEIGRYASTDEPADKAGAYAIQGLASKFIERIDGCYFNVVGLPVSLVYRHWKEIDHEDDICASIGRVRDRIRGQ